MFTNQIEYSEFRVSSSPNTKPWKAQDTKATAALRVKSCWDRVKAEWEKQAGWTIEEIKSKNPEECIIWKGQVQNEGYGFVRTGLNKAEQELLGLPDRISPSTGKRTSHTVMVTAHRFGVYLMVGEPVPGGSTSHCCGNPLCVSPLHTALGSHSDNIKDGIQLGRGLGGKPNKRKYEDAFVIQVMYEVISGMISQREAERRYGHLGITQRLLANWLGRKETRRIKKLKQMYPVEYQLYRQKQYKKLNPV